MRSARAAMRLVVLALLPLLAIAPARADGVPDCPALFQDLTGTATFYAADGTGNCSFDAEPTPMVAAVAAPDWNGSAHCGRCLRVWGPDGVVDVRVVDQCPECPSGHLDLSAEAFDVIADPLDGLVPVAFRSIECPVAGPLAIREKEGSNPWWLALQVRDHRYAVAAVEIRQSGSVTWTAMARQDYDYFLVTDTGDGIDFPVDLRVTDVHGHAVQDDGALSQVTPGLVTPLEAQLPACSGIFLDGFETGTLAPLWTLATP